MAQINPFFESIVQGNTAVLHVFGEGHLNTKIIGDVQPVSLQIIMVYSNGLPFNIFVSQSMHHMDGKFESINYFPTFWNYNSIFSKVKCSLYPCKAL